MDKIAAAIAAAQGELTNPPKTKTAHVGKYSYRYADLAEIIEHVRPVLAKHSLSVVQLTMHSQTGNLLVTRLIHASGQYLESTYQLPASAAAQDMGSAITYARRYSMCAILGIAAEEDDDGQKAQHAPPAGQSAKDKLVDLMGEASLGNRAVMVYCESVGLGNGKTVEDLTEEAAAKLLGSWDPDAIRAANAPKPKAEKKPKGEEKPPEQGNPPDDLAGINPDLAARMKAAGITKAKLKAYYVGAKHLHDSIDPEKLPASYLKALLADSNWKKAVEHMTKLV
jgi:hypothetical protein